MGHVSKGQLEKRVADNGNVSLDSCLPEQFCCQVLNQRALLQLRGLTTRQGNCSPRGVPMTKPWITVQAIQAPGQIFLTIPGKVFLPTHSLDLSGFFIEAISTLSWSIPQKKHRASGQKSFKCLVKTLLWLTACFSTASETLWLTTCMGARITGLLFHICYCCCASAIHNQLHVNHFLPLVQEATWGPRFKRSRSTRYYIKALIHN